MVQATDNNAKPSAHTPGPWSSGYSEGRGTLCVRAADTWICGELLAENGTAISQQEAEANARLIAAAPELLEAVKKLLAVCENYAFDKFDRPVGVTEQEFARTAIARAEGR